MLCIFRAICLIMGRRIYYIKKMLTMLLMLAMFMSLLTACDSETQTQDDISIGLNDSNDTTNIADSMELVYTPSEAYIMACLKLAPNVLKVAAVTKDNDPNGDLNTDTGYYSAVFFAVDLINQDVVYGESLIDKYTDAGGCIEA